MNLFKKRTLKKVKVSNNKRFSSKGTERERERVVVRRILSCDVSYSNHRVYSSQSHYSENPPIVLRRSLGLLWVL